MAKFKVGDVVSLKDGYSVPSGASGNRAVVVEVMRPVGGDFNYWLRFDGGREREQHGDQLRLANAARSRNAVVQKALNACAKNGAMAALDSSEKSKIKSIASGMPCSFMDGGDSLSGVIKHSKRPFLYIDFDVSKSEIDGKPYYEWYVHAWNRTRKWERNGGQYKIEDAVSAAAQAMRGAKQMIEKWAGGVPLNADTSVLRETAVNGKFKVGDKVVRQGDRPGRVWTIVRADNDHADSWWITDGIIDRTISEKFLAIANSTRTTNAVVAKALNARRVARNGRDALGMLTVGTKVKYGSGKTGEIVKVKKIYSHGFVEPEYTVIGSDGRTFIENEGRFEVVG